LRWSVGTGAGSSGAPGGLHAAFLLHLVLLFYLYVLWRRRRRLHWRHGLDQLIRDLVFLCFSRLGLVAPRGCLHEFSLHVVEGGFWGANFLFPRHILSCSAQILLGLVLAQPLLRTAYVGVALGSWATHDLELLLFYSFGRSFLTNTDKHLTNTAVLQVI